tara:strand:+ start:195 stop:437 length:243 start_codon:yes stop_codon:yes gene_type:complete
MSNNKQSSVDWYANKGDELFDKYSDGAIDIITFNELMTDAFQQAKAMHKEEIMDALLFGDVLSLNTAETYYKVKFGGNNE